MLKEPNRSISTSYLVPKLRYRAHVSKIDSSPKFDKVTQAYQY